MYQNFAILSFVLLCYAFIAGKLEKGPISGPIVFLTLGFLFGPFVFKALNIHIEREGYLVLAEVALALVLFSDASKTNLRVLNHNLKFPVRLLLIGLPLTILAGIVLGKAIFKELSWVELALLSTALAPTDAALGQPVVSDKRVPSKIREALNVESGLNDGICVPIVLLLFTLHTLSADAQVTFSYTLQLFVQQIGIGAVTGFGIGALGSILVTFALDRHWIQTSWKPVLIVMLALLSFFLAQSLDGSGFIASFAGGLGFGMFYKNNKEPLLEGAEGNSKILAGLVWILFGVTIAGFIFQHLTLPRVLYALASLTIIRILPVLLSLIGSRINLYERIFIAWFGPRGLASIVFGFMIMEEHLPHGETLSVTIGLTILLSVFAHGFSATPMARYFSKS